MNPAELLAEQFDGTRQWTMALIADLSGDDWTHQPAEGMAHALWLCGHLAFAQDALISVRCLGEVSALPPGFADHFPIGAAVKSAVEYDYPSIDLVLSTLKDGHGKAMAAIRGMSDSLLAEPCFAADGKTPHPHYTNKCGVVTHASRHEAFHAGQIATIRRLLGKPFLR